MPQLFQSKPKHPAPYTRLRLDAARGCRPRTLFSAAALIFVGVVIGGGAVARGQQPAQPTPAQSAATAAPMPAGEVIDDDDVLRIDSNLVTIPAVVTESTGRAVPDLKLEDFELRVDGQLKPVGELHRAEAPVLLAVLFDNSSSLSKARAFEKQAATRFFQRIVRPIDRAAVYSVSTVPLLSRPLTNDVGVLVRTIEDFAEPDGATALFDTISAAAAYLGPHEGRKVVVIISDGNDTISDTTFDQALQRALKAGCQIYVVGTGDIENPNLTDTIARKRLQVFAAQTGGALYVPRAAEDLDAVFEQIFKDISQQYVLSYYPTDDPADGRFRAIDLRVKTRPTLRVRAREGYYAAAGLTRVRPRRANGGREPDVLARAGKNPPDREVGNQAASLDPLYAQTLLAANAARDGADAASGVSFKTKADPGVNSKASPGPHESFEPVVPARPAPSSSAADAKPSKPAVEAAPMPEPSSPPVATPAQSAPPLKQATSTLEAAPEPQTTPAPTPTPAPAPAVAPTKESPRVPVSGGVLNGKAKILPRPVYPTAAKFAGVKGRVTVEVEIDEEGRVIWAQASSGPILLQTTAVLAARQARFSPTLLSGQPVKIRGTIIYTFL